MDLKSKALSLVRGEIQEQQSEIVSHMIGEVKDLQAELEAVMANYNQAQRRVESLQCRRVEIEAVQQNYLRDIEIWLKKEQDAAKQQPEVSDDESESVEPGSIQYGNEGSETPEKMAF